MAVRMQRDERIDDIVRVATELIGKKGYYGTSIQEIADNVGLSQAGVLKHVKTKKNLLELVLAQYDGGDSDNQANGYLKKKRELTEEELEQSPALLPEWYREIATYNAQNPFFTRAYLVLRAEALDESHPAHDYFEQRGRRLRAFVSAVPWKLPPEYSTPESKAVLSMVVGSAMEGLESRWLGEEGIDFLQYWEKYEDILFPLPHWEGYR